jgi:RNA polymerase subunit RPABC4/transcription elongation factor Spt4
MTKRKCLTCGSITHVNDCPNCSDEEQELVKKSQFQRPGEKLV